MSLLWKYLNDYVKDVRAICYERMSYIQTFKYSYLKVTHMLDIHVKGQEQEIIMIHPFHQHPSIT